MVRSKNAFSWDEGNVPECKVHTRIKLEILRSYLLSYFPTVAGWPATDEVNIDLIDAFSGGGIFKDTQTGSPVLGSPFVMLHAVAEAEKAIAAEKTKPFSINARFHFADKSRSAISRLKGTLKDTGLQKQIDEGRITVDCAAFESFLPTLLKRIPSRPRRKAIFFLDQTGWNAATLRQCNDILAHLPKAEIIWNISVESLANYANDKPPFRKAVERFGIDLGDALSVGENFTRLSDWRKALVAVFLQEIRANCVARYVSPFMVQHDGWGYWLLHLSNHPEANNVMKATHWQHQNSSLHEGFPGLRMLEFNRDNFNQASMWRFNADASEATHESLLAELGPQISYLGGSPTVRVLMESIANETPADRDRVVNAISELHGDEQVAIVGPAGQRRRNAPQTMDDRLVIPKHRPRRLPGF